MHVQRIAVAVCAPCGWVTRRDPKKVAILEGIAAQHSASPGDHDVKIERVAVIRCHDCQYRSGWLRSVDQVDTLARAHLASIGHQAIAAELYAERERRRSVGRADPPGRRRTPDRRDVRDDRRTPRRWSDVNVGAIEPVGVAVLLIVVLFAVLLCWPIGRGK